MKKLFNKTIFGWAMYDFANSSYATVIITALYSVYFKDVVMKNSIEGLGEYYWALTLSISYFITALASPIVGAIADYRSLKKTFLLFSTFLCVIPTAFLYFTIEGTVLLAITLIIISNIGFSFGENLISSFLPEISTKENIGKVSGFGWGLGFLGGITSLIASILLLSAYEENKLLALRLTNPMTAGFFILATIPTFLWLKEKKSYFTNKTKPGFIETSLTSFNRIINTFHHIKNFKELVKLLFAFFLYNAGLSVVISFAAIYAKTEFLFGTNEIILLIILINVNASIGAILFGFIQDKIGARKALELTILIWVITITVVYMTQNKTIFWIITAFAGIGLGSIQSATRALVGLFAPKSKHAEFYGFWGVFGKLSAIPGLFAFGYLSYLLGSQRSALLSTLIFFILGFILIFLINEKRGIEEAENYKG